MQQCQVKLKMGAVCHVVELSQVLLYDTFPDICEHSSWWSLAEFVVNCIKFEANESLWSLEFVIFLIPQVCVVPTF